MNRLALAVGLPLLLIVSHLATIQPSLGQDLPASEPTADHREFEELAGPFKRGPEVTRACLSCHNKAAEHVQESIHWTWDYPDPDTQEKLGKRHVINSFCGAIQSNYPRCTSCHAGYGWTDADFDLTAEENIDCLVCHDTTGTYRKFPTGAGHPLYTDRVFHGRMREAVDLAYVAQNVGPSSRETCGHCHFKGGGGNGVKHGDLDASLLEAERALDVHMAAEGLDYRCTTCHTFSRHQMDGSRYRMKAVDTQGIDVPGQNDGRGSCASCHGRSPHDPQLHNKLNDHAESLACQTCHIPSYARGGVATKTWWDWSTAGKLGPDGEVLVTRNEAGQAVYHSKKGTARYGEDLIPSYYWFNGVVEFTQKGEKVPRQEPLDRQARSLAESIEAPLIEVNRLHGQPEDPDARIWPFKVMQGKQPYDPVNRHLLVYHLFGRDEAAFWKGFDWDQSIRAGMQAASEAGAEPLPYSGEYTFARTRMYWPITHMVAPAEDALSCDSCHQRDGRLAAVPGIYMPGQHHSDWLERIGWLAAGATLLGVLGHGGLRIYFHQRRRRREAKP